jgi:hypothetical protein
MSRTLRVLFRRDPSKDRVCGQIHFEGYKIHWPDGRAVAIGLDGFCRHGQRLLGLGRYLAGCTERLIEMIIFPLHDIEDDLTRIPGHRVRRFYLQRQGQRGRVHFMDGTPTDTVFEIGRDEGRVLHWIGLTSLPDGARQWFDLAARAVEPVEASVPSSSSSGRLFKGRMQKVHPGC